MIYHDFAKAFDKVPHRRLIEKFEAHSVSGKLLNWIQNWLAGRTQRTVLNREASEWSSIDSGVPQGSVLGPLAFVVYINDLDDGAVPPTVLNKFADDTKCAHVVSLPSEVANLQTSLDNLVDWSVKWGMTFNVAKCKVMHIGRANNCATYTMGGTVLAETDSEKDVGVKVHKSLKPSTQCSEAARRANAVLGQICRSLHYRDKKNICVLV